MENSEGKRNRRKKGEERKENNKRSLTQRNKLKGEREISYRKLSLERGGEEES